MEELNVKYVTAKLSTKYIKEKKRFNEVVIHDATIDFKLYNELVYTVPYKKSDGICKKNDSELIIATAQNRITLEFQKYDKNSDSAAVTDTTETFYNAFKDCLTERFDIVAGSKSKKVDDAQQKESTENILQTIGIIGVIAQFIFFLIAKFNLKNTYDKEVIGTIQIGNMVGADTAVSHSSSTNGLGVFAVVMMGICCVAFFVLAGLSSKKGTGKGMPVFGVFAVLTIIGGFIVAIY